MLKLKSTPIFLQGFIYKDNIFTAIFSTFFLIIVKIYKIDQYRKINNRILDVKGYFDVNVDFALMLN